jgi:outer membrane protein insertion porin family
MTKKLTFLLYCLYLPFAFRLFAQTLSLENQTVEKINVVVHTTSGVISDSRAISARMSTKQGGIFFQTEFDNDLKALAQDFDRIEPTVESLDGKVSIDLNIWPKPNIRSLEWVGNKKVKTSILESELGIKCYSTFERLAFNQAFHKLKAYYMTHGFFEAELDYQINYNENTNEVNIVIEINEGRSGKIQEIVFVNFEDEEKSAILDQMVTKKYNLFSIETWMNNAGVYNEEAVQQDQLIITNYLQNAGYADAQVKINIEESTKTERIIITVIAERGAQYIFRDISFEGNQIFSSEAIDKLFMIRKGTPFSLEKIRETLEGLTEAYGRRGYIDSIVDFEPELVEGEYKYDVRFKIEEGEQYRVGLIRVFGNNLTKTSVILHETPLVPGEIFNSVKLKITEIKLQNIGYFKNVNVYIVKGSESPLCGNYRDVYIEVEETSTGQFSAFMGYSSIEELFGGFNITERNFNHEGFYYFNREGLKSFRGGGEYLHFTSQIGQKSRSYVLSWTKPYFLDTQWAIGFDLSNNTTRYISKEYDLETSSLNLRAQYNINQYVRLGLHYRLKNGEMILINDRSDASVNKKAWNEMEEESHIHGLISAVGASLSYDSTDHPVKPSNGFRSRLSLEFAGVWGDHSFLSLGYFNGYYLAVGSRSVLKYRADFRFLQPLGSTHYDSMPVDERIFLGGESTIRGYRPYRIGPEYPGSHIPRGGLSMQLYSVELNRQMIKDIEFFAFFDAGHLSSDTWEFGRLSMAVGYGGRFKVIESIPQITVGIGYPLNPRNRGEVKKFFISVGGNF